MTHGIQEYFLEQARFERRVAGMIVGVAISLLAAHFALIWLLQTPAGTNFRRSIRLVHWGYEGPEQYVRRIELKVRSGVQSSDPGLQAEYVPEAHRGGHRARPSEEHPNAPPETRKQREREGESEVDRVARSRAQLLNVPLVQSEDLIVEELVEPQYPDEALNRGISGRVAVLALVDTTGVVTSVESVGAPESELLVHAAEAAVRKCRFRPYRVEGQAQTVYALFRYRFTID